MGRSVAPAPADPERAAPWEALEDRRLIGLIACAAIAFAACSGSATPVPSQAAASQAPSQAPTPVPTAPIDLGKTDYLSKVTPATHTGGTLVMAEWQTVSTFNPYYVSANSDAEAQAPSFDALLTVGYDLAYVPEMRPTSRPSPTAT